MVSSMTAPESPLPLLEAFEHQDEVFPSAFSILREAITLRAFPAASIAITYREKLIALKALGHFTYDAGAPSLSLRSLQGQDGDFDFPSPLPNEGAPSFAPFAKEPALSLSKGGQGEVNPSTLFDLASLTKVVATTPMAMLLYERGLLDLDAPVAAIIPEFTRDAEKDPRRHEVTLRMLLAHSSGLPAYEKLFLNARSRDQLLQAAFTTPLAANPATRAEYSDIGASPMNLSIASASAKSSPR